MVIYFDLHKSHLSPKLKNYIENKEIGYRYFPPCCWQYNPIERYWSVFKNKILKRMYHKQYWSEEEFEDHIHLKYEGSWKIAKHARRYIQDLDEMIKIMIRSPEMN